MTFGGLEMASIRSGMTFGGLEMASIRSGMTFGGLEVRNQVGDDVWWIENLFDFL